MMEALVFIVMLAALLGYAVWEREQWRKVLQARINERFFRALAAGSKAARELADAMYFLSASGITAAHAMVAMRQVLRVGHKITTPDPTSQHWSYP